MFLAKVVTFVVALLVLIGFIAAAGSKGRKKHDKGHIEVTNLNDSSRDMADTLRAAALDKLTHKQEHKNEKKQQKQEEKTRKKAAKHRSEERRVGKEWRA